MRKHMVGFFLISPELVILIQDFQNVKCRTTNDPKPLEGALLAQGFCDIRIPQQLRTKTTARAIHLKASH